MCRERGNENQTDSCADIAIRHISRAILLIAFLANYSAGSEQSLDLSLMIPSPAGSAGLAAAEWTGVEWVVRAGPGEGVLLLSPNPVDVHGQGILVCQYLSDSDQIFFAGIVFDGLIDFTAAKYDNPSGRHSNPGAESIFAFPFDSEAGRVYPAFQVFNGGGGPAAVRIESASIKAAGAPSGGFSPLAPMADLTFTTLEGWGSDILGAGAAAPSWSGEDAFSDPQSGSMALSGREGVSNGYIALESPAASPRFAGGCRIKRVGESSESGFFVMILIDGVGTEAATFIPAGAVPEDEWMPVSVNGHIGEGTHYLVAQASGTDVLVDDVTAGVYSAESPEPTEVPPTPAAVTPSNTPAESPTPANTVTPVDTPAPASTDTPTPVPPSPTPAPVFKVWVTDGWENGRDLSYGVDDDPAGERALVVRWTFDSGDIREFHVYVTGKTGERRFLGKASGEASGLEWSESAPGIAPEFAAGPQFDLLYQFHVYAITLSGDPAFLGPATHAGPVMMVDSSPPAPAATFTETPAPTAANTETPVPTATDAPQPLPTPTAAPPATNTATPVPTATDTPEPEPTATAAPSATDKPEPVPTATETPEPTATATPTATNTETPAPTDTETPEPTATAVPTATNTHTPMAAPTNTPPPTATRTPAPPAAVELAANGNFSSSQSWNMGTGWSVAGGSAIFEGVNADPAALRQNLVGDETGREYRLRYTVLDSPGEGYLSLKAGGNFGHVELSSAVGTHEYVLTAADHAADFILEAGGKKGRLRIEIDDISIVLADGAAPGPTNTPAPPPAATNTPAPQTTPTPAPAPSPTPTPTASGGGGSAAETAMNRLNYHRAQSGVAPLALHESLVQSAEAHSHYLAVNNYPHPHTEDPSLPGFTGAHSWDRAQHFGFPSSNVWEGVGKSAAWETIEDNIDIQVSGPIHRYPVLHSGLTMVGYGEENGFYTIDYGATTFADASITVYPGENQTDVPKAFYGGESPEPFPGARYPLGYSVTLFGPRASVITVQSYWLRPVGGDNLPLVTFMPNNPYGMTYIFAMSATSPLQGGTEYEAHIEAKVGGTAVNRTWRFRTKGTFSGKVFGTPVPSGSGTLPKLEAPE